MTLKLETVVNAWRVRFHVINRGIGKPGRYAIDVIDPLGSVYWSTELNGNRKLAEKAFRLASREVRRQYATQN